MTGEEIRLFSVKKTAEMLDVSTRTVWTLIQMGHLRITRIGKRSTRVLGSSIWKLIKKGEL